MHTVMTQTIRTHEVSVPLREYALNVAGCPPEYRAGATVVARVPGGDWSNENLDVDEVVVSWTETAVETTER